MFVVFTTVTYGNGIVSCSDYDEILKQVQDDVSKGQRQKVSSCPSTTLRTGFFSASSYCAELEAVCSVVQRNGILLEMDGFLISFIL